MRIEQITTLKALRKRVRKAGPSLPDSVVPYRPREQFRSSGYSAIREQIARISYPLMARRLLRRKDLPLDRRVNGASIDGFLAGHLAYRLARAYLGTLQGHDVLLPGCYFNSAECRFWLEQKSRSVTLLDIVDWSEQHAQVAEKFMQDYGSVPAFAFGSLEQLPFADHSFDVIETRAVLEHVADLELAMREVNRVLRPGGLAIHSFGPLYFTAGGDHCASCFGLENAYCHILMSDEQYQATISDGAKFPDAASDAARFWALHGIFSYLRPQEYLDIFDDLTDHRVTHAVISAEGLAFRAKYPQAWAAMLANGMSEEDLLTAGYVSLLGKR